MLRLTTHRENTMRLRTIPSTLAAAAALAMAGWVGAQTAKPDEDHSAHHPPGSPPPAAAPAARAPVSPEAFDKQMKAMQGMHQRMQSARTPAERAALMDEHMKVMQAGMAMMGQMGQMGRPGGMGQSGMGQGGMGMPPQMPASGAAPGGAAPMAGMSGMMGMHQQMERRMALMEQMMQMMMDREATRSAPAK